MGPGIVPQVQQAVSKKDGPDENLKPFLVREVAAIALAPHEPRAALPALLDGLGTCVGLACTTILRRMGSYKPAVRTAGIAALRRLLAETNRSSGTSLG